MVFLLNHFLIERLCIHVPFIRVRSSLWVTSDFLTLVNASIIYLSLDAFSDWLNCLVSRSSRSASIADWRVCMSFSFSRRLCETSEETRGSLWVIWLFSRSASHQVGVTIFLWENWPYWPHSLSQWWCSHPPVSQTGRRWVWVVEILIGETPSIWILREWEKLMDMFIFGCWLTT